jgi:hypothetical protein
MVRFVKLSILIYALWTAVYFGSQIADWAHKTFTIVDVRLVSAID